MLDGLLMENDLHFAFLSCPFATSIDINHLGPQEAGVKMILKKMGCGNLDQSVKYCCFFYLFSEVLR